MCFRTTFSRPGEYVLFSRWYIHKAAITYHWFCIKRDLSATLRIDLKTIKKNVAISLRNKTTSQEVFYNNSCDTDIYLIENLVPGKYVLKIKYFNDSGQTLARLMTYKADE